MMNESMHKAGGEHSGEMAWFDVNYSRYLQA